MSLLTFDTHEFVKRLKSVGFTEEQAEVFAGEHRRIIEENLVTKEHFDVRMRELDVQMRELEYRLTIKLGGMMMAAIIIVATLVKLL